MLQIGVIQTPLKKHHHIGIPIFRETMVFTQYCSPLKTQAMAQQIATIEDFTYRYFSLQQTALVDNMLYEDKHMELFNHLYNLHTHTVELSSGSFTGTHNQLMTKRAAINTVLQQGDNDVLRQDIVLLETVNGTERNVYEWYAVPYWIAKYMIDSDEVVLSWKDCYWWGRCSVGEPLVYEITIESLFEV